MSTPDHAQAGGAAVWLRDDIDHGRTGDKADWLDPAAAPLGTDDEAAGSPLPGPDAVRVHRTRGSGRPVGARGGGPVGAAWVMIAIVIVAVAGVMSWMLKS